MEFTKIIGWLTFLVGISIILFTLYSSYNIFTGKMDIPEIFRTSGVTGAIDIPGGQVNTLDVIVGTIKEIFPSDAIPRFLNLSVWMMLAGILIFGGTQVANLGIKLIKTPAQTGTSRRDNPNSHEVKTST